MYPRLVLQYQDPIAQDVLELLLPLSARIICGHHYIKVMQCCGLNSGFSECQSSTLPTKPHLLPPETFYVSISCILCGTPQDTLLGHPLVVIGGNQRTRPLILHLRTSGMLQTSASKYSSQHKGRACFGTWLRLPLPPPIVWYHLKFGPCPWQTPLSRNNPIALFPLAKVFKISKYFRAVCEGWILSQ